MTEKKWVELVDGKHLHHSQINEFTVITRPASEGEVLAFESLKLAETDMLAVKDAIDGLKSANDALIAQVAQAGAPYQAQIDDLQAKLSAALDENEELKGTLTALRDELDQLKISLQNQAASNSAAPDAPAPAPAAGEDQTAAPADAAATEEA